MSYIPIYRVALVRECSQQASTRTISGPVDVYQLMRERLEDADREIFAVLMLDTRNRIIGIHPVSIGSLSASVVCPRETFKAAILANAAAILCVHNHPSGDPEASPEDLAVTTRLKESGELLGIPVLDHVIVGHGTFVSLKDRGML